MSDTQQLAEMIRQRHECLSQLAYIGHRQVELIDAGDMATLLSLLSAKQRLLTKLQDVERRLEPFRDQQPEERVWSNPAEREACARQSAECGRLLGEVFQLEQRSTGNLQKRRDDTARRLLTLHTAHEARGAYTAQPDFPPLRQLDVSTDA